MPRGPGIVVAPTNGHCGTLAGVHEFEQGVGKNILEQSTSATNNQQPTRSSRAFMFWHSVRDVPKRKRCVSLCHFMSGRKEQRWIVGWIIYTMHPKFILKKNDKDKDLMKFPASNRCTVLVDYLLLGALDPLYWHKLDPNSTPSIVESLEQGCHSKLPSKVESFCW